MGTRKNERQITKNTERLMKAKDHLIESMKKMIDDREETIRIRDAQIDASVIWISFLAEQFMGDNDEIKISRESLKQEPSVETDMDNEFVYIRRKQTKTEE